VPIAWSQVPITNGRWHIACSPCNNICKVCFAVTIWHSEQRVHESFPSLTALVISDRVAVGYETRRSRRYGVGTLQPKSKGSGVPGARRRGGPLVAVKDAALLLIPDWAPARVIQMFKGLQT